MRDERREPSSPNAGTESRLVGYEPQQTMRGPFSTTVERLASAFNRSRVNKKEADERRRRSM